MKHNDIYDTTEKAHEEAFKKMPKSLQYFISACQKSLQKAVISKYPQAIPTSGFRCVSVNNKVGGVADSLHLYGMARDFYCKYPIIASKLSCSNCFQVIKSKPNIYHVQYRRGK